MHDASSAERAQAPSQGCILGRALAANSPLDAPWPLTAGHDKTMGVALGAIGRQHRVGDPSGGETPADLLSLVCPTQTGGSSSAEPEYRARGAKVVPINVAAPVDSRRLARTNPIGMRTAWNAESDSQ